MSERHDDRGAFRRIVPVLVVATVIAALTLTPTGGPWVDRRPFCVVCGDRDTTDILLNLALYAPLGAALAAARLRPVRILLLSLVLSGAIEAAQAFIPWRDPSARDIAMNALGAWSGAMLWLTLPRVVVPAPYARARLAAAAAFPALVVALSGWLLTPVATEADYFGHWRPTNGPYRPWSGSLTSASIAGLELHSGRLRNTADVRQALRASEPVIIRATAGAPTESMASIFAIVDAARRWPLLLARDADDLVLRRNRRASDLRLETPTTRFADVLAGVDSGATLVIAVEQIASSAPCLVVNGARHCAPRTRPVRAWALLRWDPRASAAQLLVLDLFLAVLLAIPAGLLLLSAGRASAAVAVVAMAVGVFVAATESGLAAPSPAEWIAMAVGLGVGSWIARLTTPE